ncbi:MAG: HAD family hydrolase [Candidatus Bathyarchaeia archaeon]
MPVKAIAFDLIGTIVHVKPNREAMLKSLFEALKASGLRLERKAFYDTYRRVNQRYMELRVNSLREFSNPFIVAETLDKLGHPVKPEDSTIVEAVKEYFKPYIESVYTTPGTRKVLTGLKQKYRLGIVTNFTFPWTVNECLKKTRLNNMFNPIVTSADVGWRKPHPFIFKAFALALGLTEESIVFVGDDLKRDIYGADKVGMKTILLSSGLTETEDAFYEQKIDEKVTAQMEIRSLKDLEHALKTFNH